MTTTDLFSDGWHVRTNYVNRHNFLSLMPFFFLLKCDPRISRYILILILMLKLELPQDMQPRSELQMQVFKPSSLRACSCSAVRAVFVSTDPRPGCPPEQC